MASASDPAAAFCLYDPRQQRVILTVHIQPGASTNTFGGLHGDALKIRVAAPAVDNKANAALLTFLAKALDVRKADLTIRRGDKSRHKVIDIAAADRSHATRICEHIHKVSGSD